MEFEKYLCLCGGCGGWECVETVRTGESVMVRELPHNVSFTLLLAGEMLTDIHREKGK